MYCVGEYTTKEPVIINSIRFDLDGGREEMILYREALLHFIEISKRKIRLRALKLLESCRTEYHNNSNIEYAHPTAAACSCKNPL